MRKFNKSVLLVLISFSLLGCSNKNKTMNKTASEILGNPNYLAMSYGGYRQNSRSIQPSLEELKEDMKILAAMGVKIIRTYNVQLDQAKNVLQAITELKKENENFEMYVMLGAWIDCKNAWTEHPVDHNQESEFNIDEINRAVALAKKHADIVKIIAVGNEAMVKWATSYYVQPDVILKWVNHLQELKKSGELSSDVWITSSDNFASWGGGDGEYHTEDLNKLIHAVDYISMHTYPMHDTHYHPVFWGLENDESKLTSIHKIDSLMLRSKNYAISQYERVKKYMESIGAQKPIHIGETGWASYSNELYGNEGSKATDAYKEALFYKLMREWTNSNNMSCFYFEAFDEPWKDANNPGGSENYFGLFTLNGEAKYALWNLVDKGNFKGLSRNGHAIKKTFDGNLEELLNQVQLPENYSEQLHY